MGRAAREAIDMCLRFPFGIRDELSAVTRAQQFLRDAAILRNNQGGAFSFPDVPRRLGLRRINPDMNEADNQCVPIAVVS